MATTTTRSRSSRGRRQMAYPPDPVKIVVPPPKNGEPPNWEIELPEFVIPDPTVPDIRKPEGYEPHYHRGQDGLFHRCYHHCRNSLTSISFWIGMTIGFPLEHTLWEKVPGFA